MSIKRGPKPDHDFTTLYNSTLRDKNISWGALGLLVYLLSHKPDWKVSATHLAKERKLGRDGIYKLLNELRQAGYAEMRQKRQGHGRMGDVDWIIHELPLTAFPEAVPPDPDSPDTANPEAVSIQEKQELAPLTLFPEAVKSPLPDSPDTANPDHKKNYQGRKTMVHPPEPTSAVVEGGVGGTAAVAPATPDAALTGKKTRKGKAKFSIPDDWMPSDRCLSLIEAAGIPEVFAAQQLGEFIMYWQERGDKRPGWDSTFLNLVKDRWERKQVKTTFANRQFNGHRRTPAPDNFAGKNYQEGATTAENHPAWLDEVFEQLSRTEH